MINSLLRFHHFGLAVRDPGPARVWLAGLGYEVGEAVFDPGQNVFLAMGQHPSQPAVELIWPAAAGGPIDTLVQQHQNGIVYHLCYETDDLPGALAQFKAGGMRVACISRPKPAPLFGGRPVSFYNVVGVGLIEILESKR